MANDIIAYLHFDDGITDEMGNVWEVSDDGNYTIDTSKTGYLGTGCANFGTNYLKCTSDKFKMGTQDFTVEFRVFGNLGAVSSLNYAYDIVNQGVSFGQSYSMVGSNRQGDYAGFRDKALVGQWNHIAIVRHGARFNFYVNGHLTHYVERNADYEINSDTFHINAAYVDSGNSYGYNGYYDEVIISLGAKWTADFDVPTQPIIPTPPTPPAEFTVTQKYQDEDGNELKPETSQTVTEGDSFNATAPDIKGYKCIGYKIDNGDLQSGSDVVIDSVTQDLSITFVYEEVLFTVTEKYQDEKGNELKPDVSVVIREGSQYAQMAFTIAGYKYVGYKIDDGDLQSSKTVVIDSVEQELTVVFIYKKTTGNGGNDGGGGAGGGNNGGNSRGCCCVQPVYNFYNCCCCCEGEGAGAADNLVPNTNGRSWSLPVPANPLSDEVALIGYPMESGLWNVTRDCSYDGKYIWTAPLNGRIDRINLETVEIETFQVAFDGVNVSALELIFDGEFLWALANGANFLVKINPETVAMEKVALPSAQTLVATTFDGEFIWFADGGNKLFKFDPKSYQLEEFALPVSGGGYRSIIYVNGCVWVINRFGYEVTKVNVSDMSMDVLVIDSTMGDISIGGDVCSSVTSDGRYIWLAPTFCAGIIRIDTNNDEITAIPIEGDDVGDTATGAGNSFINFGSCSYDGKYVWFIPYTVNRLLRMDSKTNEFKGYDIAVGEDLGSAADSIGKFWGSCFDGENIWMMPALSDRLVQVKPLGGGGASPARSTRGESDAKGQNAGVDCGCRCTQNIVYNFYNSCHGNTAHGCHVNHNHNCK